MSLRDSLRSGASDDDVIRLIGSAVIKKKKQHAGNYCNATINNYCD